MELQDINI